MTRLIKSDLNDKQWEAVTTTEGPVLVIAGAGSGKTRILTERIVHLVQHKNASPWAILAFTFTNKAAKEMKGRLEDMAPGISNSLWVGTFHSTGVRILRAHGQRIGIDRRFSIYDSDDSLSLIKGIVAKDIQGGRLIRSARTLKDTISRWKNELVMPGEAYQHALTNVERRMVALYLEYEKELKRANALDFDDLIVKPVTLFSLHDDVKAEYAERFRYILVDEFQDTNPMQMALIDALSSHYRNIFVVGDDDQSIYSWRGARIEHILNFENLYPDTALIRLERNYRSTQTILDAANHVIACNQRRKGKNLWTDSGQGEKIKLIVSMDEETEASNILLSIQTLIERGLELKDIAVLYRTNAQSRALEDVLKRGSLPYQIIGTVRFYDRMEVRDVLAYCKLLNNPADIVSLRRIINVPKRSLGKTTLARLEALAAEANAPVAELIAAADQHDLGQAQRKQCREFTVLLAKLGKAAERDKAPRVVEAIIDEIDYRKYLQDNYPDAETRVENIEELVSAAEAFADTREDSSLRAFLEEIALVSDVDSLDEQKGSLTLMTLHNAKGLEFDCIIIAGLEEGLCPHHTALDKPDELEEERRLFYVGMTRARKHLYLSFASLRRRMGKIEGELPSRFLSEIPEQLLEGEYEGLSVGRSIAGDQLLFGDEDGRPGRAGRAPVRDAEDYSQEEAEYFIGARVYHQEFGKGIVRKIDGSGEAMRVTVLFDGGGERKFVAKFTPMRPI